MTEDENSAVPRAPDPPEDIDAILQPPRHPLLPPGLDAILKTDVSATIKKLAEIGNEWANSPVIGPMYKTPDISPRLLETPITLPPSAAVETARVRQEISAMATIAQAQLEELGALQVAITELKSVVDEGQRQMVWPTRLTIGLAAVLVIQTFALIFLAWALLVRTH